MWLDLHECYLMDQLMGGLKTELHDLMQMQFPKSLDMAIKLAKLQESVFKQVLPKQNPYYRTTDSFYTEYKPSSYKPPIHTSSYPQLPETLNLQCLQHPKPESAITYPNNSKTPTINNTPPVKKIIPSEMKAIKDKGLCYLCEEPYTFGHKCKNARLFMMTTENEANEVLKKPLIILNRKQGR